MSGAVLAFSPVQAAELADDQAKRFATARARCALLGATLHRRDDGALSIGLRKFQTLEEVEDFLDGIVGDE